MKERNDVTTADIQEMKALNESGDLEPTFDQAKATFRIFTKRDTTITEKDFLHIHAMDDDGPSGDEWWVARMIDFEQAA